MNAVVLTVKASYVASTKYKRKQTAGGGDGVPLVVWKMRAPDKKPLVRREAPEDAKVGLDTSCTDPARRIIFHIGWIREKNANLD